MWSLCSLVGRRASHAPKQHIFLIIIFELQNMYTFRILMFPKPKMVEMTPVGPKLTTRYYKVLTLTTSIFGCLYISKWTLSSHWALFENEENGITWQNWISRWWDISVWIFKKSAIFAESALFWIFKCRYLSNDSSDGTKIIYIWKVLNTHYQQKDSPLKIFKS